MKGCFKDEIIMREFGSDFHYIDTFNSGRAHLTVVFCGATLLADGRQKDYTPMGKSSLSILKAGRKFGEFSFYM